MDSVDVKQHWAWTLQRVQVTRYNVWRFRAVAILLLERVLWCSVLVLDCCVVVSAAYITVLFVIFTVSEIALAYFLQWIINVWGLLACACKHLNMWCFVLLDNYVVLPWSLTRSLSKWPWWLQLTGLTQEFGLTTRPLGKLRSLCSLPYTIPAVEHGNKRLYRDKIDKIMLCYTIHKDKELSSSRFYLQICPWWQTQQRFI